MLVLSPDSTCDVCMDNYTDGAGVPHALRCGHVFCLPCLTKMQPQCPLCRYNFNLSDIFKLHLDIASPATVTPQVDTQTQRLWGDIANAGRENATFEEMQLVINECEVHQNPQLQGRLHNPLLVTHRLLSNLLEARRMLHVQAGELTELKDNRDRLMWDLVMTLENEEAFQALNDVWRSRRTEVASGFESGVETNRNWVESPAYRSDTLLSFLFEAILALLASMSVVLLWHTLPTISKLGGKR